MTTIRPEERCSNLGVFFGQRFNLGIRHDHAAGKADLRVRTDISNFKLAGFLVQHERALILARRCISFIELPVNSYLITKLLL